MRIPRLSVLRILSVFFFVGLVLVGMMYIPGVRDFFDGFFENSRLDITHYLELLVLWPLIIFTFFMIFRELNLRVGSKQFVDERWFVVLMFVVAIVCAFGAGIHWSANIIGEYVYDQVPPLSEGLVSTVYFFDERLGHIIPIVCLVLLSGLAFTFELSRPQKSALSLGSFLYLILLSLLSGAIFAVVGVETSFGELLTVLTLLLSGVMILVLVRKRFDVYDLLMRPLVMFFVVSVFTCFLILAVWWLVAGGFVQPSAVVAG